MQSASQHGNRINISELIDHSRIGRFQAVTFALCAASLIMDGFDVQAMGFVGPELIREWGLKPAQFGQILGATNLGVLFGAIIFSMLADRLGRRPVLIGTTLLFSVLTLMAAGADSFEELRLLRFLGGFGMGAIIPNATALIGELSPKKNRVTLIMTITVGFTGGAALAGLVSAWLIPAFGWRSVLVLGGVIPLIVSMLMFFWLPESLEFLVLKRKSKEQIARWLSKLAPALKLDSSTEYAVHTKPGRASPFRSLFLGGRALTTLMLWLINFMNLLNIYFLAGWMPQVLRGEGYTSSESSLIAASLQLGGLIGTFGLAWLIAGKRFVPVLSISFAVAAASIALVGTNTVVALMPVLALTVFVAGWCAIGGQPGLNALAATYYPTDMRSTGVGFCLGVGRVGAIAGPLVGGYLIQSDWSSQQLFYAAASASMIASLVSLALAWTLKLPHA